MRWIAVVVLTGVLLLTVREVCATPPSLSEMALRDRWMAAKFAEAKISPEQTHAGLVVVQNHDWVSHDGFLGAPLHLGGKAYYRGLFCHAPSTIRVRLPKPGQSFEALAGVDTNQFSAGGKGSIVFTIGTDKGELFRSPLLREGMAPAVLGVALGGAAELTLSVEDGGDGISCDTAAWAEARATLEDGELVWIGDLPIIEGQDDMPCDPGPPFSFTYDGKPFAELAGEWRVAASEEKLNDARQLYTLRYADPGTGLEVRCVALRYRDFPTIEWTLYFKNTGLRDTPIIENIQPLDTSFQRHPFPNPPQGEFLLHHWTGSQASQRDYAPQETLLPPEAGKRMSAAGGRPTNTDLSYFNLEWGGQGAILAVGWPGQWAAEFTRDDAARLHIRAGQELTHFRLRPGEEVRTPLIVLQFWQGDWVRAQNVWRRWMMAHSMPKPGGALPPPMLLASSSRAYEEMIRANEATQIMFINRYLEEGLKLDYWWMDAGWYPCQGQWPRVGTWEVDKERFPNGFRPISDYAHSKGIKILVWFEPERVHADTWLSREHPEWILGGEKGGLLDLGNAEARRWLTDHVDQLLTDEGIDLYRQDFNMDPLDFWRKNDAEDRQGITEIKHVTGYLAYWDELRRRHPNMLIDSCASGGRRNDLESMRRAVPLWRSDYAFEPIGHQGMTYGLSFWLPFHGTGTVAYSGAPYYGGGLTPVDPYAFWSNACPSISCGFDLREKELDYETLRTLFRQWRDINSCYYGDYYPLTPYSNSASTWTAWQWNRPEAGDGVVQAFRRPDSVFEAGRLPLRGLEAQAAYRLEAIQTGETWESTGDAMMQEGLRIAIEKRPGAAVIRYTRITAETTK